LTGQSKVGEHIISYLQAGTKTGPAVLLVHGIGVSHHYFEPLIERMERFNVIAIDLPGFGNSSRPAKILSVDEHAILLEDFLSALRIKPDFLIGHSMGCQVIASYAQQFPGFSGRLVMLGPTVYARERNARMHLIRLMQNAPNEPLGLNLMMLKDYTKCGLKVYFKTLKYMLSDRIEDRLPQISTEAVFIRGEKDPIAQEEWVQSLKAVSQKSKAFEVPGAGHGVHYSHPHDVLRLLG
jgi:pimeloyl-ACP methyl ester carboxylesterase